MYILSNTYIHNNVDIHILIMLTDEPIIRSPAQCSPEVMTAVPEVLPSLANGE